MYNINHELSIPVDGKHIRGNLRIPGEAHGLVIFSHGSGSSRFSPRNQFVADYLNKGGFATLLIDLLTEEEDRSYANRFDIGLLTNRLVEVTRYVHGLPGLEEFPLAYFGASTGAASALRAASVSGTGIQAIVSRGGRPDLAAGSLANVKAPTLLIVGSLDGEVITLNRRAYTMLTCEKKLEIIHGASHLFEEPGKLVEVAELSREWFVHYLQHTQSPVLTN